MVTHYYGGGLVECGGAGIQTPKYDDFSCKKTANDEITTHFKDV